jgi:hypothetical protein
MTYNIFINLIFYSKKLIKEQSGPNIMEKDIIFVNPFLPFCPTYTSLKGTFDSKWLFYCLLIRNIFYFLAIYSPFILSKFI